MMTQMSNFAFLSPARQHCDWFLIATAITLADKQTVDMFGAINALTCVSGFSKIGLAHFRCEY